MANQYPERILLIIPEMIVGGAQRSLAAISLELARYYQVWIVIFNRDFPVAYSCGGELISLDVAGGSTFSGKYTAFRRRVRKLRALKKQLKPDVAISFLEGADYVNILSREKERVVLSIRGSKIHDETMLRAFNRIRKSFLIPFLYPRADHIVTVNDGIARELQTLYAIKVPISVIYNFYDAAKIKTLRDKGVNHEFAHFYSYPVIVFAGRLATEKGISFLLAVFARLLTIIPTARFMVVGDGPRYEELIRESEVLHLSIQQKEKLNPDASVIFTGNQGNVFSFMKNAAVYVLASSSEGFPNGMAEAMTCGVPVVAADCPYGPREILSPGTSPEKLTMPETTRSGILMPMPSDDHGNQQVWADTVANVIRDEWLNRRLSSGAIERSAGFSAAVALEKWHRVINPEYPA